MTQNEKSKIRAKVIKWVTRLFLILVAIIMLYPLAWNVVSSFKTSTEFLTDPFAWPQGLAWDNYVRAYEKSNLAANIGNSIYVVLETLVIIVICVVPCSYCLVRYKFPGAKLILNIYDPARFGRRYKRPSALPDDGRLLRPYGKGRPGGSNSARQHYDSAESLGVAGLHHTRTPADCGDRGH